MQQQTNFIAVIGGANMDLLGKATGPTNRADSNTGQVSFSPGGVARNIAENLAHLGSRCELIAPLGDDPWGRQLTEHCETVGIGMTHRAVSTEHRTSTYLSICNQHGELISAISDMEIIDHLTPALLRQRLPILKPAACWVLDANLSSETLAFLFEHAGNIPVWVDPVSVLKAKKLLPHLPQIHCMTPNLYEAALLTNSPCNRYQDAPALARELHRLGVAKVMITLGKHGAYASDQQDTELSTNWLAAEATQIRNVTGCGDAAIAALIHANNRGMDWHNSCKLAMAAAALTAASEQTNTPSLQTLAGHS
ncbi:MAG: PfkB family carbohydrate kinase [Thiolinea sp.]